MIKKTILALMLILALGMGFKTIINLSFKGNEKNVIIGNYDKIMKLEELINLPEFQNKTLYVNVYNTYCGASIDEFQYFKEIQKQTKERKIVFIHLCTPKWTYQSNWKKNIKIHSSEGYHVLMNDEFYDEIWTHFPNMISRGTPFHFIVDTEKKIKTIPVASIILDQQKVQKWIYKVYKFVQSNLDAVRENLPYKLTELKISISFNKDLGVPEIRYQSNESIVNNSTLRNINVWDKLDLFISQTFDSISNDTKVYPTFLVPLEINKLESLISNNKVE